MESKPFSLDDTISAKNREEVGPGKAAEIEARCLMHTYKRAPVVFVEGNGSRLIDTSNKSYLDFVAGIATVSLGHCHPRITETVSTQASRLVHTSNLYYTLPQLRLAEELRQLNGWGKAFFASSGAEAVECAIKLVRKYWHIHDRSRRKILALDNSFHGRTMGALSITGQPSKREPFEPLIGEVAWVNRESPEAVAEAMKGAAGIFVEVIQGEGGVLPLRQDVAAAIGEAKRNTGTLVIVDEVQTGLCRTGKWLGFWHDEWTCLDPDVFTLGKALGNGFPISACVARDDVADAFEPGDHATTLGGGPVVAAVACEVLEIMRGLSLDERAAELGHKLASALASMPGVRSVRGKGLLLGVEVEVPAEEIAFSALENGLLVNALGQRTIRLSPPLTVSDAELDEAIVIFEDTLKSLLSPTTREVLS